MKTRSIKSPKELLEFLFGDAAGLKAKPASHGPHASAPHVEFSARLEANFGRLREIARAAIRKAGLDPAHFRKIARERDKADTVFWSAQMLLELDRIQQHLARMAPDDLEAALGEVLNSLAFAGQYHALIVAAAPAVTAFGAAKSAPKGAHARNAKFDSIALRLAEKFRMRQRARDLAAGAHMGFPRPSDAELKRQIGAEHGLAKSAAIDAINRGLVILSATGAALH